MTVVITKPLNELTLTELKDRAKKLGIDASQVEPIEATGDVPVKADWVREVLKAEGALNSLKDEWRDTGSQLVAVFGEVDESEASATGVELATKLASGTITNVELMELKEAVKATAAVLREADERDLAKLFSQANYLVRRAERATRAP